MATTTTNGDAFVRDQLSKLEAARKLVLADASFYPQTVTAILPIIGATSHLEVRRWGADFLAETFASPSLAAMHKQSLCLAVLDTLRALLDDPGEDTAVLKGVVQASASIYPLVFRHIIGNDSDVATWAKMAALKSKILRMWDSAAPGVRICCIKFVQRVIHVQTPGVVADPRRPDQSETSLALVPRQHALIPPPNLEAEASGLLDRLLGVFQDPTRQVTLTGCIGALLMSSSDSIIIDATLNSLGVLIRSRASIANKIIYAVLNFDPHRKATRPLTPKDRVVIRSLERTTRALLVNVNKQNPNGALAPRIQQYVDRLNQSRLEVFDDNSRKRGAPSEPTDGLDQTKRARLGAQVMEQPVRRLEVHPLPPGPVSAAQLFTITTDSALTSFDVRQFPVELVLQLLKAVSYKLDQRLVDQAVEGIKSRLKSLAEQFPAPPQTDGAGGGPTGGGDDEDDDYEPDYQPAEDSEQLANKMDEAAPGPDPEPEVALAPFKLPQPPPLSGQELSQVRQGTISRVVGFMNQLDESVAGSKAKTGINRLAASNFDRAAWVTLLSRLATRASSALEESDDDEEDEVIKTEEEDTDTKQPPPKNNYSEQPKLGSAVRENLYRYVIEDFRKRIDAAVSWLNEEWYNDKIQLRQERDPDAPPPPQHYPRLARKVLDGLLPYVDSRDRFLTRFVSELPELDEGLVARVKSLARDPERVALAVGTLHYLILYRPPVKEMCIDALEDLWMNYNEARPSAAKLLAKFRPEVLKRYNKETPSPSGQEDVGSTTTPGPKPSTSTSMAQEEQVQTGQENPGADADRDGGGGVDGAASPSSSSFPATAKAEGEASASVDTG